MIDGKMKFYPITSVGFGKTNELTITDKGFTFVGKATPHGQLRAVPVTLDIPYSDIIRHTKLGSCYVFICKTHQVRFEHKATDKAAIEYILKQYQAAQKAILEGGERYLRCNVCGRTFTYSPAEEFRLKSDLIEAQSKKAISGATTLFYSTVVGSIQEGSAQSAAQVLQDRIDGLRRCPGCKSNDTTEISKEEAAAAAQSAAVPAAPAVSAMDELKKLKELLDMGIVTQEEFDAKKKQLLGL